MRRRIGVVLGREMLPVGELRFEDDGTRQFTMFRYAQSWLERPGAFALAPDLPLDEAPHVRSGRRGATRSALPGPVSEGTPDSWGRGLIEKSLGRPPNELEFLLSVNDETRQGALRFVDEAGRLQSQGRPPVPRLNDLDKLLALARAYETYPAIGKQRLGELVGHAGSLGGARPKSDFDDGGVLAIAKFTSERDTRPVERVEVATLNLARAAGLNAAEARLELSDRAKPVAIIRRFDRRGRGRIPYLSAQSFIGRGEARGGYYTDILDSIAAHGAEPGRQMEELHKRLMFTILVSNNDDHLKNHGFLYASEDRWVLAPAFDINPQPERHRSLETGISEEYGRIASIEAAVEAAPYFDLGEDRARENLKRMVGIIESQWAGHCRAASMSGREIAAYRPAFDHEEMAKARRMVALTVAVARRIAGVDRAAAVHSAEVEQAPASVASPPPQAVTGDHTHPAEHLPEPGPRPESVIARGQDQTDTFAKMDLTPGPATLPRLRRELRERAEADSAGRREDVAEYDRRIKHLVGAARVSGYEAALEAEPAYRAWAQATRTSAHEQGQSKGFER